MRPVITAADIGHHITNQREEYAHCSFAAGRVGMSDFSRLYPVLRCLPPRQLTKWMQLIDSMRATHDDCASCTLKVLAYSILFTRDRLPKLSLEYTRLYQARAKKCYRPPGPGRDYMGEVLASIDRECVQA